MPDKTDHNNDYILVARIRNDDKEAFKSLYDHYWKKVFYFSLKYLHNNEEAEDVVQTVFLNLWINRKMLDEKQAISSYIFKSAVNHIYNNLKKKAVRFRYFEATAKKGEPFYDETNDLITARELDKTITKLIEDLPEQQKKVFLLSRKENLTCEEISHKLGISVRTVENHMYRALKFIRKGLSENL